MSNIARAVETMAQQQPNTVAIYYPHRRQRNGEVEYLSYTYQQLLAESDAIASGLTRMGLKRGMSTVLMVKPSLEFFALTFALIRAGIVPVIVDPGIGVRNLKTCLAEAEPEAFIGIPTAHLARGVLGWGKATIRHHVTVGRRYGWGGSTLAQIKQNGATFQTVDTADDETAAIIFTSGSTGVPKGVIYTHGNFVAQVEFIQQTYQIQPGEIDLPTFPVFALFDPALGMTTIIPEMDFTRPAKVDPTRIAYAVKRFNVTNMFGSPALLNRVGRYGVQHDLKLPTLRRVISAGAPVPADVLERFTRLLDPEAQIFTPYGATESLPVASISGQEILGETRHQTDQGAGVCVGWPVAGVEVKVIRISDEPIPTWDEQLVLPSCEIGEIVVKGANVTRAYYNREQATRLAKIQDGEGFYHRMGDLGYFDEQGRLWFCGRKAHRVVLADQTLFTDPVESVFNTHPLVYRTALVGVKKPEGMQPVLCVELEAHARAADHALITRELLAIGAQYQHTRPVQTLLYHPAFPVDIRHNSKIFREKLAIWAAKKL